MLALPNTWGGPLVTGSADHEIARQALMLLVSKFTEVLQDNSAASFQSGSLPVTIQEEFGETYLTAALSTGGSFFRWSGLPEVAQRLDPRHEKVGAAAHLDELRHSRNPAS